MINNLLIQKIKWKSLRIVNVLVYLMTSSSSLKFLMEHSWRLALTLSIRLPLTVYFLIPKLTMPLISFYKFIKHYSGAFIVPFRIILLQVSSWSFSISLLGSKDHSPCFYLLEKLKMPYWSACRESFKFGKIEMHVTSWTSDGNTNRMLTCDTRG